jgi:ribulose-phosphate 3-epimerase
VNLKALVEERGVLLAPSVLSADLWRLEDGIRAIEEGGADLVHLDVMDGVFVPNISMGFPLLEALREHTSLPLDVHLMIVEPERYVERFVKAGASIVSFQVEATYHPHRVLGMIREAGAQAGIVINPGTPVEAVENLLEEADMVLVMSVNPGFGGQKFILSSLQKIKKLYTLIENRGLHTVIEVDGGIGETTIPPVVNAGARVLVAGSAVFGATDVAAQTTRLRSVAANSL